VEWGHISLDICRATKGAHIDIYLENYILKKKLW
jgi:hypothetical protein